MYIQALTKEWKVKKFPASRLISKRMESVLILHVDTLHSLVEVSPFHIFPVFPLSSFPPYDQDFSSKNIIDQTGEETKG